MIWVKKEFISNKETGSGRCYHCYFFNSLRSYHKISIYTYFEGLPIIQFSYTQSRIPSSNKGIHDLLRSLKDTEKLRNKTTASGELVDNQTSQDSLKTSIKVNKMRPFSISFLKTLFFFKLSTFFRIFITNQLNDFSFSTDSDKGNKKAWKRNRD